MQSTGMQNYLVHWKDFKLELGPSTAIMGIVNVTPDSFSDGGLYLRHEDAVAHGLQLVQKGAAILDIGGESTRPFSDPVSLEQELERVIPVIERLAPQVDVPISIDTTKAAVAKAALEAGASIINDISALRLDPEIADVAAQAGVPLILMHMKGTPRTMQVNPQYDDLCGEIAQFLSRAIDQATERGVKRRLIIIDPGIGFGKTFEHNLQIIKYLERFRWLDAPILVGPSRKAFIRALVKDSNEKDIPANRPEVITGTQAAVTAAVLAGAHIVRVHDVGQALATVKVADAIRSAPDPGPPGRG